MHRGPIGSLLAEGPDGELVALRRLSLTEGVFLHSRSRLRGAVFVPKMQTHRDQVQGRWQRH
jgi:hypothetical protein